MQLSHLQVLGLSGNKGHTVLSQCSLGYPISEVCCFGPEPQTMYSAALLEHFNNPRNAGDLPDRDASVKRENPVCGDVLELSVKLDHGRIAAARFKAQGCVPAIACASAITHLVSGKSLEQARRIRREDLLSEVDGVPPASMHAVELALDTLRHALSTLK